MTEGKILFDYKPKRSVASSIAAAFQGTKPVMPIFESAFLPASFSDKPNNRLLTFSLSVSLSFFEARNCLIGIGLVSAGYCRRTPRHHPDSASALSSV
ncbi:hypothetical protein MIH18_10300 [Marinobacter sp. M3C]|uniref:hypothetical protein n=1 Tax=unclassified Marinobacter TaxID=83889 RepID=UPI0020101BFB|nr:MULTISPECIES: hypothetical protein [unclassified Marinobacter]MCL1479364.1 hypothetical protein [Marinobacter sp.]MCL1484794.1 hypothetical protein [Marinobacter sp.]UQG58314.1 hypothetical protein MIH16_02345 [Marinobacter sp. M4C]UQG62590.1 hypothetical protein MIH18_10300 [Marinobacter sp. M3C]UQG67123.1 hypothetical protein MIH17_02345 [Marinobacter sp. M2C]